MLEIKRSLATKQLVRVTLVSLIIICIFLTFLFNYFVEARRKDYVRQLEGVFHSIEQPLAQDVWDMDYDGVQTKLDNLNTLELLSEVDVIIPGQYRSLHGQFTEKQVVPDWFADVFRLPVTYVRPLYAPGYNNQYRLPIAQLVLKSASYQLYLFILHAGVTLLLTFLSVMLLQAAALSWIMKRLLITPLKDIASTLDLMPTGIMHQLSMPAGHDDDELGVLVKNYNRNQRALEKAYQGIRRLNTRDKLTNLPNRVLFDELVTQRIANAGEQAEFSLLYLGVNSVRETISALGLTVTEQLLLTTAERLKELVGSSSILAHLGNDEFVILSRDDSQSLQTIKLSRRIVKRLTMPIAVDGLMYYLSVNIGVARYPNDGNNVDQLLSNAHSALLSANRQGKNNVLFFEPHLTQSIQKRLLLENEITQGIQNREFVIYLQPLMDMRTDELVGVEALVRWPQSDNSLRPPDEFIPLAEETGLIIPLGQLIFEQACQYLADWQSKGIGIPISVNLAAAQIDCADFPQVLAELVKRYNVDPAKLRLEVTETGKFENIEHSMERLRQLNKEGFAIVLDDFGIGYSNLNYLKLLSIDTIKIDKSFTKNEQWNDKNLVEIVGMIAKTFAITVVAEGVETEEQKSWLLKHEIYYGQGYLYDPALPKDVLERKYLGITG